MRPFVGPEDEQLLLAWFTRHTSRHYEKVRSHYVGEESIPTPGFTFTRRACFSTALNISMHFKMKGRRRRWSACEFINDIYPTKGENGGSYSPVSCEESSPDHPRTTLSHICSRSVRCKINASLSSSLLQSRSRILKIIHHIILFSVKSVHRRKGSTLLQDSL